MEYALLLVLAILIFLPSFMTMRKQRERQNKLSELQQNLYVGQKVITAGGLYGTVAATREQEVDLEVAGGVVITFDKMAIVRTPEIVSEEEANGIR